MKKSYETCQQHEAEFVEEAEEKHRHSEISSQWNLPSTFKMHHVSKHIMEIIIQGCAILQSQKNSNFSIYFIKLF